MRIMFKFFFTNFSLYGDIFVMNILSSEVLKMEVYSIDEAFLDFFEDSSIQRGIFIREKIKIMDRYSSIYRHCSQ